DEVKAESRGMTVKEYRRLTNKEVNNSLFNQCLKEAWKLSNKHVGAELDNLDEDTIEAVLYKVRHEMNLLEEEGNIYDDVPTRSKNAYYRNALKFMEKWGQVN